jgi:uncharacterized paraquat-inducible protein A
MSRLVARILLTVLLFPSATLVLFLSFLFIERLDNHNDEEAAVLATLATCAYMMVYWLMLWRGAVNWTEQRVYRTLVMTAVAAIVGCAMGVAIAKVLDYSAVELGTCGGLLTGAVLWMILTIVVWRETPAERAARLSRADADALVCPTCGYNLTGLREPRCPECGTQFTLNELYAAQPARAPAEIEAG